MNNEVLRRKMFRTILADSRAPKGILASSPEMVETVQRRANGGMNTSDAQYIQAIGQLAQQGDTATLENIFRDTRLSTNVRNAAREAIGSLTTKQAASPVMDKISGFGQGILDAADATNKGVIDFLSTAARNDAERLSNASTGFMGGVDKIGSALYQTLTPQGARQAREKRKALREPSPTDSRLDQMLKSTPSMPGVVEMAGDASDAILGGVRSLITPVGVLEGEKMVAGGDGDDLGSAPTVIRPSGDSDDLGLAPTKTVAEEVSEAAVSGADTQTTVSGGRKVSTTPPGGEDITAENIAGSIDAALSGKRDYESPEAGKLRTQMAAFDASSDQSINKLETKLVDLNSAMQGVKTQSDERLAAAQADVTKATDAYNDALQKGFVQAKEFTLEDVKDEALKLSGIDKADYDGQRKNAFWFNLMRAGLAVAAGESDNALTNIAKGLGVGLEGYGKDIGEVNSQEREDRKELRNLQLQLINNKNSRELALAAAENQFNYQLRSEALQSKEGASSRLLQAQAQVDANQLALQKLDVESAFQINQLTSQKEATLLSMEQQIATMTQKDRQLAEQRAFDTWKADLATVPDEFWDVVNLGGEFATKDDKGKWSLTPKGEAYYKSLISASLTSGLKVTDLDKSVRAVAQGQSIQGIPLSDAPADRLMAADIWINNYKEEFEKSEPYAKRNVLERYIRDAGQYLDPEMPLNILDSIFPSN